MTKRQDLYLQRRSRSEQSDQRQPNQGKNISHQPRASPNSTPLTSRSEFPTMTLCPRPHVVQLVGGTGRAKSGKGPRHGRTEDDPSADSRSAEAFTRVEADYATGSSS